MIEYFLRKHVHFCGRGDSIVFLDLRNDTYSMLNGFEGRTFRCLLDPAINCPRTTAAEAQSHDQLSDSIQRLLHDLTAAGIVTRDPGEGRAIAPTEIEFPKEMLLDDYSQHATILPKHIAAFVVACTASALRLRLDRIENTVRLVQQRRQRSGGQMDLDRARELTRIFNRLRALFPSDYLCLFDSLALIEFLARFSVFPTWVFAVRIEPWAAHCWVQDEGIIFNEQVEEAEDYTPIMAV